MTQTVTCEARDLVNLLRHLGVNLTASKLRVWVHRRRLQPAGRTPSGRNLYRVDDALALLRDTPEKRRVRDTTKRLV